MSDLRRRTNTWYIFQIKGMAVLNLLTCITSISSYEDYRYKVPLRDVGDVKSGGVTKVEKERASSTYQVPNRVTA